MSALAVAELSIERHDDSEPADCVGQWCCGCQEHPLGKPWGWNAEAWNEHYRVFHPKGLGPRQRLSPLAG